MATRSKPKAAKHLTRVVIPDVHGAHRDVAACDAVVRDLKTMQVDEIVWLGDVIDCGGLFSSHQRSYTSELAESFADDVDGANTFLDQVMKAAPNARNHFIFGNHEDHLERWASRTFFNRKDADNFLEAQGAIAVLGLKKRGFKVYRTQEFYNGLNVPGTFKLSGGIHYTHGWCWGKNATHDHLSAAGVAVRHGHTHRAQQIVSRNMSSGGISGGCPGTLSVLQPLYRHNSPSGWTHGYAIDLVNESTGRYFPMQVPIVRGESMLNVVQSVLGTRVR